MKNRILVFLSVFSICFFGLMNSFNMAVYAQEEEFPDRYVKLDYFDHYFVQENDQTYEYMVIYRLPFRIYEPVTLQDYIFFYRLAYGFTRGLVRSNNSYVLESVERESVYSEFHFRVTLRKTMVNNEYLEDDLYSDLIPFFSVDTSMYIRSDYVQPSKVMKNFLLAEPNLDNGFEHVVGVERYYMYLDARVYLPDGTTADLAAMPDVISDRPDLFDGYDFIVISFNLSPRARFWSPSIYPSEFISGLSYIVYDLVAGSTTFYDYMGRVVYYNNSIIYIDTPQFILPEMEALDYQLKASYEEGKTEGYKQGREEGKRAGRRETQEEMQQIIDDLIEYYEEEVRKAYNRGRNEADFENLDMFGYLQALFGEQGLGRLLRLELLPGVSLGAVIMIPLAFWLVSFIMRWFR